MTSSELSYGLYIKGLIQLLHIIFVPSVYELVGLAGWVFRYIKIFLKNIYIDFFLEENNVN